MGPLEAAVLRGIVVPHGNGDESENLVLRGHARDGLRTSSSVAAFCWRN